MKKVILFFIIFNIFINYAWAYCLDNSYYLESLVASKKFEISSAESQLAFWGGLRSSNWLSILNSLKIELSNLENKLLNEKNTYNLCLDNEKKQVELKKVQDYLSGIFQKWYDGYTLWNYDYAIIYFKQYLDNLSVDHNSQDYISAKNNLVLSYKALASLSFNKKNFDNAILNYKNALIINSKDYESNFNIWASYYNNWNYDDSIIYYNYALNLASTKIEIDNVNNNLEQVKNAKASLELVKTASTNDPLSWFQYYLKQLNIPNAWNKVTKNNQVIVAIIDDGININHPDLTDNIWINPKAKYWSSKIIDFVWDWLVDNLATWEHWTMIAWIIWATQNNKEWIAWISKNLKLMPLRVFNKDLNAKDENIIKAMNFAIDNGAKIINLSIGWNQFSKYSTKLCKRHIIKMLLLL